MTVGDVGVFYYSCHACGDRLFCMSVSCDTNDGKEHGAPRCCLYSKYGDPEWQRISSERYLFLLKQMEGKGTSQQNVSVDPTKPFNRFRDIDLVE
jgi:hypothetical protein